MRRLADIRHAKASGMEAVRVSAIAFADSQR